MVILILKLITEFITQTHQSEHFENAYLDLFVIYPPVSVWGDLAHREQEQGT